MDVRMKSSGLKCVWVPGPVIIGAGPAGLAVAACLKQKGVPFLILEKESHLAFLWKLKTYDRLKLHLPKKLCELPYTTFPPEVSTYPTKQQFISYIEAYAKHFSIEPMFEHEVQKANYEATMGFWRVEATKLEFLCRWLIVTTGENAVPRIAGLKDFEGTALHTSKYRNGAKFKGQKVLVVGCGNSSMEVSLDLCNSGAQVSLVMRNKVHIFPREILGDSTYAISMSLLKWLPVRVVDWFLGLSSRLILGDTQRFGVERLETGPIELKNASGKTPVLDVGALAKIKSGHINVSANVML